MPARVKILVAMGAVPPSRIIVHTGWETSIVLADRLIVLGDEAELEAIRPRR